MIFNCSKLSLAFIFIITFTLLSCDKNPLDPTGGGTGGGNSGTVASFSVIPIPTVNLASQIIPNLAAFYVTNKGPYIQVQNTAAQRWSVYKYIGGTGAGAWISFIPNFTTSWYRPTSMFYETGSAFSIHWSSTNLTPDKFGMYNINTGTPSFEYPVPTGIYGPGIFGELVPPTKSSNSGRVWAMVGNEVWRESFVAVPRTFEKVLTLPAAETRIRTDAIMADPDTETSIWIAAKGRLYQVSEVGNPTPPRGTIVNSWNFNTINPDDRIWTILKVNGNIIVQFGNRVYKQNGNSFTNIGTLNPGVGNNICTNGSTIYSSDGKYYDSNTNTWKSFLGTGTNLSAADQLKYNELHAYCTVGLPIGCIYGSGPVYFLSTTDLVQVNPLP